MRVAVTGATGWLGRAAVNVLQRGDATVLPFASSARGEYLALAELPRVPHDVLLHYAYVTRDYAPRMSWQRYVAENVAISELVRSAVAQYQPAVFYASSGAAAHVAALGDEPYGGLKRLDEHLFRDASGGRCAVARVYNVAGPHVTKPQVFLLTDVIGQALRSRELRLSSRRPVVRSYIDVEDLASWAVAMAGQDVCVATAGDAELEAAELARMVLDMTGGGGEVVRPGYDASAPPDRYVGDAAGWAASCASVGLVQRTTREQVQRTVEHMKAHAHVADAAGPATVSAERRVLQARRTTRPS